jgi:tRNA(Arg) A34 adenosine deaminase TadA
LSYATRTGRKSLIYPQRWFAEDLLQFPTLNHRCEITGGVRDAECVALLNNFFAAQRQAGKKNAET